MSVNYGKSGSFIQLSQFRTHYRSLIRVDSSKAREYYLKEAADNLWKTRTLDRNISTQYYERLALSQVKEPVKQEMKAKTKEFQEDKLEFIKNPYLLEFLGIQKIQAIWKLKKKVR